MPKYVILDIDDTLVYNSNFNKYIPKDNTREAWDLYLEKINYYNQVEYNYDMINILKMLAKDYIILFVTSRENTPDGKVLDNTYRTLYDIVNLKDIKHMLFIREYNDFRPSWEVKEDLFTKYNLEPKDVVLAIDDNTGNINMFKKYGITTLQITIGDNYESI